VGEIKLATSSDLDDESVEKTVSATRHCIDENVAPLFTELVSNAFCRHVAVNLFAVLGQRSSDASEAG